MTIKKGKEEDYMVCVETNSKNEYSRAVINFLESWADLMEERILNGEKICDMAEQTSNDADTEGITGFMYGCAVNILAQVWEHGEELRRWHNEQYGYNGEGTVNPAVVTIKR